MNRVYAVEWTGTNKPTSPPIVCITPEAAAEVVRVLLCPDVPDCVTVTVYIRPAMPGDLPHV